MNTHRLARELKDKLAKRIGQRLFVNSGATYRPPRLAFYLLLSRSLRRMA